MSQNSQPPQKMQAGSTPVPYRDDGDEISLIGLWKVLMRRKYVVLGTLIAVMLAAIVDLVMTPRLYKANTRIFPPRQSNLILVDYEHPLVSFEPKKIFDEFSEFILQLSTWRHFVEHNESLFPAGASLDRLGGRNPIETDQDKNLGSEHLVLSYKTNDPERAASLLYAYLEAANELYTDILEKELRARLDQRKETLANKIENLRDTARLSRKDEIERLRAEINQIKERAQLIHKDNIAKLREDLAMAKSIGITENQLLSDSGVRTGSDLTVIPADAARNYLRGTRELEKELEALLKRGSLEPYIEDLREKQSLLEELVKRKSDDAYIKGLREKQVLLSELSSLNLKTDKFRAYRGDGEIFAPSYPIQPKVKLVIGLALILGLMLGVFAAFFAEFIRKARAENNDAIT